MSNKKAEDLKDVLEGISKDMRVFKEDFDEIFMKIEASNWVINSRIFIKIAYDRAKICTEKYLKEGKKVIIDINDKDIEKSIINYISGYILAHMVMGICRGKDRREFEERVEYIGDRYKVIRKNILKATGIVELIKMYWRIEKEGERKSNQNENKNKYLQVLGEYFEKKSPYNEIIDYAIGLEVFKKEDRYIKTIEDKVLKFENNNSLEEECKRIESITKEIQNEYVSMKYLEKLNDKIDKSIDNKKKAEAKGHNIKKSINMNLQIDNYKKEVTFFNEVFIQFLISYAIRLLEEYINYLVEEEKVPREEEEAYIGEVIKILIKEGLIGRLFKEHVLFPIRERETLREIERKRGSKLEIKRYINQENIKDNQLRDYYLRDLYKKRIYKNLIEKRELYKNKNIKVFKNRNYENLLSKEIYNFRYIRVNKKQVADLLIKYGNINNFYLMAIEIMSSYAKYKNINIEEWKNELARFIEEIICSIMLHYLASDIDIIKINEDLILKEIKTSQVLYEYAESEYQRIRRNIRKNEYNSIFEYSDKLVEKIKLGKVNTPLW